MQATVWSGGGGCPTAGTKFLRYVVKIVLPSRLCTGRERMSSRASSSVLAVLAKRVDDRQERVSLGFSARVNNPSVYHSEETPGQ